MLLLLLVQLTDPISGGAGWVGAGLLGCVLCWLLFIHLPAKDKQLKEFIESKDAVAERLYVSKDAAAKELAEIHAEQMTALVIIRDATDKEKREDFKESLLLITSHCKDEMAAMSSTWTHELTELTRAIQDLSELVGSRRAP